MLRARFDRVAWTITTNIKGRTKENKFYKEGGWGSRPNSIFFSIFFRKIKLMNIISLNHLKFDMNHFKTNLFALKSKISWGDLPQRYFFLLFHLQLGGDSEPKSRSGGLWLNESMKMDKSISKLLTKLQY